MDIMTSQTGGPDNSAGSKMWLRMLNVHNHWGRVSLSISVVLIVSSVSFIMFSMVFQREQAMKTRETERQKQKSSAPYFGSFLAMHSLVLCLYILTELLGGPFPLVNEDNGTMTPFYVNHQNASVPCFLVQIKAVFFYLQRDGQI